MAISKFEELLVWQKSQGFCVEIYRRFSVVKDFAFRDQITRASVSISNNIAEGFDRGSNADFKRFLFFSTGSTSEVRSMLYLSIRLNLIEEAVASSLIKDSNEISKMLFGLIKSLK